MACGRRAQNEIDRIEKVATVVEFQTSTATVIRI